MYLVGPAAWGNGTQRHGFGHLTDLVFFLDLAWPPVASGSWGSLLTGLWGLSFPEESEMGQLSRLRDVLWGGPRVSTGFLRTGMDVVGAAALPPLFPGGKAVWRKEQNKRSAE